MSMIVQALYMPTASCSVPVRKYASIRSRKCLQIHKYAARRTDQRAQKGAICQGASNPDQQAAYVLDPFQRSGVNFSRRSWMRRLAPEPTVGSPAPAHPLGGIQ